MLVRRFLADLADLFCQVTRSHPLPDIWDPHLPVIQVIPLKVLAYLHILVRILLALTEWDLHLPAHGFQDPLDQGNILEDLPCQVNRPSSLGRHVVHRRCKVNPRWILCVDRQELTASIPTPTSHVNQL